MGTKWFQTLLVDLIERRGISASKLSRLLDMNERTIYRYLSDEEPNPTLEVVMKVLEFAGGDIKRALPVPPAPDDLIFGIRPDDRRGHNKRFSPKAKGHAEGVLCLVDYSLRPRLKRAAKLAKIERPNEVTPHALRHSFATLVLQRGATVVDTAALLRHRNPVVTLQVYVHESMASMRGAVDRLAQPVKGSGKKRKPLAAEG